MNKRRSLENALSQEEEEFLSGNSSEIPSPGQTVELNVPSKSEVNFTKVETVSHEAIPPHANSANPSSQAQVDSFSSLNTRVHPTIGQAFMRASLDRRMRGIGPSTKRAIVEEALSTWLRDKGYLQ